MTIDEFIDKLSEVPAGLFRLTGHGQCFAVRADRQRKGRKNVYQPLAWCPLTYVCEQVTGNAYSVGGFQTAGTMLDMNDQDIKAIQRAADRSKGSDPALRARILTACKLTEAA